VLPFSQRAAPDLLAPGWIEGAGRLRAIETLHDALSGLASAGGTDLAGALRDAAGRLAGVSARERRVLLLTDGDPDHEPDLAALNRVREDLTREGVRFSAIVVGDERGARALRETLAEDPRDVHELADVSEVPERLLRAVGDLRAARELLPAPTRLLVGAEAPPPGVLEVEPRAMHHLEAVGGSRLLARAESGADLGALPFAAERSVGAGRVAGLAWGPALEDPSRRERLFRLLGPWLAGLARSADRGLLAERTPGGLRVEWPEAARSGSLRIVTEGEGASTSLVEVAPGTFEGPAPPGGEERAALLAVAPGGGGARPLRLPARPPREHAGAGADLGALEAIAQAGGGRRLAGGQALPEAARGGLGPSLAPWLLLLAVILFLWERARSR